MSETIPPATKLDPGAGLDEQIVELPDGRRIRTIRAGDGFGPLIVLEAGMSAPAACWAHTQRELSTFARTLSYDRAGYGGSDVDRSDRTLERLAEDLTSLLDAIGESEPVVLVGHSWGGPIIRCFADRHPERVAGMVFVDATVAELMTPGIVRLNLVSFRVNALLARLRRGDLIVRAMLPDGFADTISSDDQALFARDYAGAQAMAAGRREAQQITPAVPLLERLEAAGTPDVPTVSLQGGKTTRATAKLRPRWNAIAASLMETVPQGRVIVVDDAGHMIPQERPDVVHEAILEVFSRANRPADGQDGPDRQ
ncbi:alpha/beta fold hydrolase [Microbacterium sp. NPDC058345]|uniref:alpha/beta fold hydrolase n=1 Tax=Microbacterium sp. NPDC058345 TaxID=3346455 RepID=UPI00365581A3